MRPQAVTALWLGAALSWAQQPASQPASTGEKSPDTIAILAGRLSLESYKATIKGLTQFGDRRQGTDRNRAAVDWIEAQLKRYGCTDIERLHYEVSPPAAPAVRPPTNTPPPNPGAGPGDGPGRGGVRLRGTRTRIVVNNDATQQSDGALRELNSQPSAPGPREEVYCTKIGTTHPEEMYIVAAHMDGIGWGEAANDDGSGTALVMELARVFSDPEVRTERSIRFALWNSEESGLSGARAYVAQRKDLQGQESPAGSGRYPEPKWLGMVQHDMLLFDHGMPHKDGTVSSEQRAEADVNIEYQVTSKFAEEAMRLAHKLQIANEKYATDYPANIGPHMSNTDSVAFQDLVAAISVRENERLSQIGNGWDPHWHQATDRYATFSDNDFRLGLNAAQTTLGAIAELAGTTMAPLSAKGAN